MKFQETPYSIEDIWMDIVFRKEPKHPSYAKNNSVHHEKYRVSDVWLHFILSPFPTSPPPRHTREFSYLKQKSHYLPNYF